MDKSVVMDGVVAGEDDVLLMVNDVENRVVVHFVSEAGYVHHEFDLVELLGWLDRQVPGSVDFPRLDTFLKLELGFEVKPGRRVAPGEAELLVRTRLAATNDHLVREPVAYTMDGVWTNDEAARLELWDSEVAVVVRADARTDGVRLDAVLGWVNGRFPGIADMSKIVPALDDAKQALEAGSVPVSP